MLLLLHHFGGDNLRNHKKSNYSSILTTLSILSSILVLAFLLSTTSSPVVKAQQHSTPTLTPSQYIDSGDQAFKNHNYQQAISKYTSALDQLTISKPSSSSSNTPGSSDDIEQTMKRVYIKRAETYQLMKRYKFALSDIHSILKLQSNHQQALSMRGQLALLIGWYNQSVEAYQLLIKLKSEVSTDVSNRLKKALSAQSLYNQILKKPNNDESADQISIDEKLGLLSTNTDSSSDAHARKCVQTITSLLSSDLSPNSIDLLIERAHCALVAKLFPILQQDIKSIHAQSSTFKDLNSASNTLEATILYAKYLYLLGDIESAKNTIKAKCLRLDPENLHCKQLFKLLKQAERLNSEANSAYEGGNYRASIEHLKQYIELMMEESTSRLLPIGSGGGSSGDMMSDSKAKLCQAYGEEGSSELVDEGIKYCSKMIEMFSSQSGENSEYKVACLMGRAQLYVTNEDFEKAKMDANQVREANGEQKYQQKLQQIFARIQQQERINSQRDHYKALGFDRKKRDEVTLADVKKAYKKLVKLYHPDKHKTQEEKEKAGKKYKEVTEAYEVLSDDSKRQRYDAGENDFQHGDQQHHGGHHGHPFSSFFQEGAGGGFPGGGGGGGFRFHFG